MGRVASFGSVNVDRVADLDAATLAELRERHGWFPAPGETRVVERLLDGLDAHVTGTLLGGKGANQAVAAARAGAESRLFGKAGRDRADHDVGAALAGRGVDVSALAAADVPTGTAYVFVGPDGENHIAVLGGANDAVDPAYARAQAPAVAGADVVLVQNEVPRAATRTLLDALADRPERPTVMLDPAPAAGTAALLDHPCVDVVTPNETEADALAGTLDAFEGVVVRTRGPDPVVVEPGTAAGNSAPATAVGGQASATGAGGPTDRFEVAPPPASPVDTTGAGDVFAGYLGAELARGSDLRAAVEWATAAASLLVEERGVQRATPDRDAVRRRLAE